GPLFFPRQFHRAVRGQIANEIVSPALGPGRAGELELCIRGQTLEDDRLQRAGRELELDDVPTVALADCGLELDTNGESAGPVEARHEPIWFCANARSGRCADFRERRGAGEQLDGTAFGTGHSGSGREGEEGAVAAQIADQIEI